MHKTLIRFDGQIRAKEKLIELRESYTEKANQLSALIGAIDWETLNDEQVGELWRLFSEMK